MFVGFVSNTKHLSNEIIENILSYDQKSCDRGLSDSDGNFQPTLIFRAMFFLRG